MKTKKTSFFMILFLLLFTLTGILQPCCGIQVEAAKKKASSFPACPSIDAEACCVMDLSSGLVLYSKNMKKKNYPASITKIMTTLLTIENCSPGEEVTFSAEAVNSIPWDGTKLGVLAGEKLDIEQSLYAIMLQSANDVCAGVAEYISGSQEKFAKLMTKRAKEIGCVNTHFTNPHGLHDENHYTCAYDMCLIGREAMKNSIFRKVTATRSYTVSATNMSVERPINNHHQMINGYRSNYAYEYDNCIGGKTGYTSAAGNTLVTFAKKDNMELVCVVMRASATTSRENQYTDTKKLIEAAFENYHLFPMAGSQTDTMQSAVSDNSPMFTKYSRLLSETSPAITAENNAFFILPKGIKKKEAKQSITYLKNVTLSDTEETVIGNVSYTYGGKEVGQSNILYHPASQKQLARPDITYTLSFKDRLSDSFLGRLFAHKILLLIILALILGFLAVLFIFFLLPSINYNRRNRKRKRENTLFSDVQKSRRRPHRRRH